MDDFLLVKTLSGAIYGKVALVRHRPSHALYAIKMMSLAHMSAQRAVSGPKVREDGNNELRILRRISGNRVYGGATGEVAFEAVESTMHGAAGGSWSMHAQWEAKLLEREADASTHEHHHILTLHTDFIDMCTNSRCLVFDYCPYGELYDQLQKSTAKALGVETARGIFLQIATAVRYIHSQNIAHRDLSLENVLVDANKQCRLGDFGLSSENGLKCSGRVGKAFYMAPEVYDWQPDELYDGLKADVWSLGIVLFIMVTGAPPFETPSDADARFRVVKQKGVDELLRMWKLQARLPEDLRDVLSLLLSVDVCDRPTIEEVWTHPWLQELIDVHAVALEGMFSDQMVSSAVDADALPAGYACARQSELDVDQVEPQDEVEAEAVLRSQLLQPNKRNRKRMKITIEDVQGVNGGPPTWPDYDVDAAIKGRRPPALIHESPIGNGFDGAPLAVPPRASPMVWPKVGVSNALRSLFRPRRRLKDAADEQLCGEGADDGEEKCGDCEGGAFSNLSMGRRRPRLDSCSSCSSSVSSCSSSSSLAACPVDKAAEAADPPISQIGAALCRFCLQWVSVDRCHRRVTLPTREQSGLRRPKTRRVCDACYQTITMSGDAMDDSAKWFFGTHHAPQVA